MSILAHERPRALIAAGMERQPGLLTLFAREPLIAWDAVPADSLAYTRFMLQHHACDMLVVSAELIEREGNQGFTWLAFQDYAPALLLGDDQPEIYARAYDLGVDACLTHAMAQAYPPLLHSVMRQAVHAWETKAAHARLKRQLADSARHVDRLVQMIWRITPSHDDQWYSQRHMLERLDEEMARCQRHKVPLSVAVGEIHAPDEDASSDLPAGSTEAIIRGKRRCDVVGQYGPSGFMLLMVHTPKSGGITCCKRLQQSLEQPPEALAGPHRPLRSYFGLASAAGEDVTPQGLLRIAEENLDAARERLESRVVAS